MSVLQFYVMFVIPIAICVGSSAIIIAARRKARGPSVMLTERYSPTRIPGLRIAND